MKRHFARGVILLCLSGIMASGQIEEPRLPTVPLVESGSLSLEQIASRRLWQREAADNALRSGLASIAVSLYDQLLEGADPESALTHEVELNRISAFIALGQMETADGALGEFRGVKDSRFVLRRAIVSFFLGDRSSAETIIRGVSGEAMQLDDLPWYYLLLGLFERRQLEDSEENAYLNRARLMSVSPEQRAQIDLIIYRTVLLESGKLDENDLRRLKFVTESELEKGNRAGFQFAKEYVIALYTLGRTGEAVLTLKDTLPHILEADYDLRDEFLLLQGIILGRESSAGRDAFRTLLSSGVITDLRLRALQELVYSASSSDDIENFLSFTSGLNQAQLPRELVNQILNNRAQLLYRSKDYVASEAECGSLLQNDPDTELRESTLRLLVLIAFQRQRYRTASGLLIELSELVSDARERNRIQLLVADCFFKAGDFTDAAESYGIAIRQEDTDRGVLLFQWVLSEISAGNLERAESHMEATRDDTSIDPVQKWKALWNLLTALQRSKKADKAYDLLNAWLTQNAREVLPVSLWVRLLWFRCQLSLKTGSYESTPVLAGEVYAALTDAKGKIDQALGIKVWSLTQILEGQALVFAGRQDEGLELMETVRRDYPHTRAAAQSYLAEARYYASENRMVDAQRRLIELADSYSASELAPVALYEAALHALTRGTESTQREANLILNRLADNYPEHPLVFYGRLNQGNLLRSFNDFGGAEVVFEQLLLSFPRHKDRAIVEMAQAECILAQTDTSQARFDQAIGRFERLAELPDLPIDLRVEASWKWAFSYERRDNPDRVIQLYWLAINQFLINEDQSEHLGSTGRYWMSKIIISLGEALEAQGDVESARRVYSLIPDRGLPFKNLAEGKLSRLAQKID
ncbi:MAG: tetratricopeptide repeat protein [Verrucomicrobia bacterium]|nr:tetratricopeptide repeat protein [Verrucomicrobiota bacterium]